MELLNEGLIWRIGNRQSMGIWSDRWISTPLSYAIQTPIQGLPNEAKVCSLIDENTNWWNIGLINEIFSKEEAAMICNIPICPQRQVDKLEWVGTKNGEFSVRSTYHLAMSKQEGNLGSCSDNEHSRKVWRAIWGIQVPAVTKKFLWKACSNILPTKLNLVKKGINTDPRCPICGLQKETVEHALWTCEAIRDVWVVCSVRTQKSIMMEVDFVTLLMSLMDKLEAHELQKIVTVAKYIWLRRNKVLFLRGISVSIHNFGHGNNPD